MTYITENIIAMGFPAGDMSSGFFGYVEVSKLESSQQEQIIFHGSLMLLTSGLFENVLQGFYRNHMEEVIKFFETHHKVRAFNYDAQYCKAV